MARRKLSEPERTRLYEGVIRKHSGCTAEIAEAVLHAGHLIHGYKHPIALAAGQGQVETGLQNIWGHDPTIFVGHGQVTNANVAEYLHLRGPHGEGGMQGAGVWQNTYYTFQDEAERAGGLEKPKAQAEVYARFTNWNRARYGKRSAIAHYNGAGFVAWVYAGKVLVASAVWRRRFAAAFKAAEKGKR